MTGMKTTGRIGLFAGTTEGRILAEYLAGTDLETDVFVATEYGREELSQVQGEKLVVFDGRMDEREMEARFLERTYDLVLDATHPYAANVTENIRAACEKTGTKFLRVLRDGGSQFFKASKNRAAGESAARTEDSGPVYVESAEDAVRFLAGTEGNVFVTTGSKELAAFCELPGWEKRVYARVLSLAKVVEECAALGFQGSHLIAMQGPFSEELNTAMLKSVKAAWMVTKESGRAGGFEEKKNAALRLGVGLVIIGRPAEEGISLSAAFKYLEETFHLSIRRQVKIIGAGPGAPALLTAEARRAIGDCDLLAGAKRIVEPLSVFGKPMLFGYSPEMILGFLDEHPEYRKIAAVVSGDTGFYSGAKRLYRALKGIPEIDVELLPGISSMVCFFAKIGKSWENAKLLSLHGRNADLARAVRDHKKVFALLGDEDALKTISAELLSGGFSDVSLTVGENLTLPDETIFSGKPAELSERTVKPLSVILIENPSAGREEICHGLDDSRFIRGQVPMTKMEVRAVSVSKLLLLKNSVIFDVGAGTGSVSVECARLSEEIKVYALERDLEALELLKKNRQKFQLPNMEIIPGDAAQTIPTLPAPTHVFIGGSGGKMGEIIRLVRKKNPGVRVVVNLITVESLARLSEILKEEGIGDAEYTLLSAARSKKAESSHLMMGQNPVWIVSFGGEKGGESNEIESGRDNQTAQ